MKKSKKPIKDLKEDLECARRVEQAWQEYEQGKFKSKKLKEFKKELEKW